MTGDIHDFGRRVRWSTLGVRLVRLVEPANQGGPDLDWVFESKAFLAFSMMFKTVLR